MAKLELVEATLETYGFSFYVVNLPDDQVEDKLALGSPETGLISKVEYQNFLFSELVVNLERLYQFLIENTGGDPEAQLKLRDLIEAEIYKVNAAFRPEDLVLNGNGIIKPKEGNEGTVLSDNPDWNRIPEDSINPYVTVEEIQILDVAPEDIMSAMGIEPPFLDRFDTVDVKWKRTNIDLKIRKFSKEDLPFIFGPDVSFTKEIHYQVHIIQKCLEKAESVFALCDAMGITQEVKIPVLAEELYRLCIEVNPFLRHEDVNLDEIKTKRPRRGNKRSRKGSPKEQRGSGKKFSEVTKAELLSLADRMKAKVVGQEEPIDKIVDTIQIASCGLRDPEKPLATYLMCGTTGIGKTFTAKVLAEELCGSRNNIVRIDCSEYTQQHDVQKLTGAPPSYVGYEDGGFLTNAIQENPFSVVLFDEIEKAHNKLFDLMLQIMDDARLTDGKGNVTDFRNCIILMTSNIGVTESEDVKNTMGFGDAGVLTEDRRNEALKEALKKRFRPEFLNRIDETLSFRSLNHDDALGVIDLLLQKVKGYLSNKKITAEFTTNVKQMIFDVGFSKKYGARPLQRTIDKDVVKPLAKMLLREEISEGTNVKIDYKKGSLVVREVKPRVTRKRTKTTIIKA